MIAKLRRKVEKAKRMGLSTRMNRSHNVLRCSCLDEMLSKEDDSDVVVAES